MSALTAGTLVETVPREVDGAPGKYFDTYRMVLLRQVQPPNAEWLANQPDPRYSVHAASQWWSAMLVEGGLVSVPEPLVRFVREATYDDFMEVIDHANSAGRKTMASVFPELLEKVLRRSPSDD